MTTPEGGETLFINAHDSVIVVESESVKFIIGIIEDLITSADEAFKSGHYLEASMILFQYVEYYLKLVIDFFVKKNGSSGDTIKNLRQVRFLNLVMFVDLIKPETGIIKTLFGFNEKRNKFTHYIFEYESIESLNEDLKTFYRVGLELIKSLKSIFPIKLT